MATFDLYLQKEDVAPNGLVDLSQTLAPVRLKKFIIDFQQKAYAASDVLNLFQPAVGDLVLGVTTKVLRAQGGTATVGVGDGTRTYVPTATSLNAAVGTVAGSGLFQVDAAAIGAGFLYTTAGTIAATLQAGGTYTNAKFQVVIAYISLQSTD